MCKVYGILTGQELPSRGIDIEIQRSNWLVVVPNDAEFMKDEREAIA